MWGLKIFFRALTTSGLSLLIKAPLELDTFNLGAQFHQNSRKSSVKFRQFESMGLDAKNSGS